MATWEAGKGVFAIEFTVGYGLELEEMGIPMEQFGFLGQVSAITGKDYTNYDVFHADIAQHADERTLNDLDVFLRWLWQEVLNESELNVYVGLAFETHAEGMNVYLYYVTVMAWRWKLVSTKWCIDRWQILSDLSKCTHPRLVCMVLASAGFMDWTTIAV